MASDQISELLELMNEDPAWLQEFYSAVANSELVMPLILHKGQGVPISIMMRCYTEDAVAFDPRVNDYVPLRPGIDGNAYCLLYSNRDIYENIKPILESKIQNYGQLVEPVVQNGRQLINRCCKKKQRAAINLYADEVLQYKLSFEQMEIIRGKSLIARPKAASDAPPEPNPAVEELERDMRQLQASIGDIIREKAEMEASMNARLKAMRNDYEKLAREKDTIQNAVQDSSVPVTVWEAVENVARRFASRLIIHPDVKDIVEAWPYRKKPKCVTHTVKMLEAVARTLYPMKFESPDGCIDPLQFQGITGYELAMTEGKMTKRNQALDALRSCKYEDRAVLIYAHLKKRIDHNLQMRIYIGFLEEERKILIGHVGPHMSNSQTPVRRAN
jgi:hypothetical protein